jgi:hypothetical protein
MNTDKAYLFGLIVGAGRLSDCCLSIVFPYKQWGEVVKNPERAGEIARDIVTKVQPIFRNEYKMDVFYKVTPNWRITTSEISNALKNDLEKYGLPLSGDIREFASIDKLTEEMNEGVKRAFIAGLADSIGSLAPSHRRFSDAFQILSFEFKGKNFGLVASIIKILKELGCVPDQILWNHPNQHSGTDRYYPNWRKGFKIRVILDDYIANGSFLFQAKKESAVQNRALQGGRDLTGTAVNKRFTVEGAKTVHVDENSSWLPKKIKGYHFIHNQHLAAVLNCEAVPKRVIQQQLDNAENLINPFTILTKGTASEIKSIIEKEPILKNRIYSEKDFSLEKLIALYEKNRNSLIFGNSEENGYPVNHLLQGIAYVLAASCGIGVKGKRVTGNFLSTLKDALKAREAKGVKLLIPELMTPLIVEKGNYSAMIGATNPKVYKKLIQREGDLLLKIRPIQEKDLI